jgi:P-loop Domain of unknown function (DUF2791)
MSAGLSAHGRREIIDALRRGTVPARGLGALAVGTDRFAPVLDDELNVVAAGAAGFKAVRGEYGTGKTFTVRWVAERARAQGFATSEVQISEGETPLCRLETIYRRAVERLSTRAQLGGALGDVIDGWFYALEQDVLAGGTIDPFDEAALMEATNVLADQRLANVARLAPALASVLRAYRSAVFANESAVAEGLLAWLGGQPNVAASIKKHAGVKGDLDHDSALAFLSGLLTILRDSGHRGLVLVLDEVETLQRMRSDTRERSLNALRQLIDEIDAGRFPGLYLLITGTGSFFDGPQGMQRLAPLAQRLHTDFATEARFDNLRAPQIRLAGFGIEQLVEVGRKVRDIYAESSSEPARIGAHCDDEYIALLARSVTGDLGGKVGIAPRIFLKKLVGDVLDRIDQHPDFNPRLHYQLTIADNELTELERHARAAQHVDDIEL